MTNTSYSFSVPQALPFHFHWSLPFSHSKWDVWGKWRPEGGKILICDSVTQILNQQLFGVGVMEYPITITDKSRWAASHR